MSKVVVIRISGEERPDRKQYFRMLETGLGELYHGSDLYAKLGGIFSPGRVAIKINCLARRFNSTPSAITDAFGDILEKAGVDANNIIVWERTNRELKDAGFELNASSFGRQCLGTDSNGVGYGREFYNSGDVNSLVSNILLKNQHSVNLPILKDHSLAGMSGCLKNMYGAIHNPNKFHDDNCSPFAAHISNLNPIRDKNRLVIVDATRIQYNNGPGYDSRYLEQYGGLIISEDPVAADTIGLEILSHLRQKNNLPSLEQAGRPVKYLKIASELGLGVSNKNEVDLKVMAINKNRVVTDGELLS